MESQSALWKHENHSHFWIENGELFESYHTIRGLRFQYRIDVGNLPNTDKCPDDMLKYIAAEFFIPRRV